MNRKDLTQVERDCDAFHNYTKIRLRLVENGKPKLVDLDFHNARITWAWISNQDYFEYVEIFNEDNLKELERGKVKRNEL